MKTVLRLSDRINVLEESATIAMSKLSRELLAGGEEVINLSLGEPDFDTPQFIKDTAVKALKENFTHYSPVAGFTDLREAVADKLKRENGLTYHSSQIIVSTGAKQSLMNAIFCVVNPGDEVLVPTPYWGSYSEMIKLAGGIPVFIPGAMENNFKITAEQLECKITERTKLFMFSSPNNPTGSVYTKEELAALVVVFEKYPAIYILSDEIYEHINYIGKHHSIAQFEQVKERVLLINGFSKAYAMTGWRLGYMAASSIVVAAAEKLQGQTTSGTSSITQKAGLAAYSMTQNSVHEMSQIFKKRRDLVYSLLSEIPGLKTNKPEGAFYFFPDVSAYFGKKTIHGNVINNAKDLAYYLLFIGNVATVSGDSFGNANHLRISYAASEPDLVNGLIQIKRALLILI
ncbi:pyridoxal phosphate-dependent aminotransferase [Pedobacter sp. V48]|uniref:pyridoxal phosphate-dependent aminotransferase n=1 Tax=Pedobacter sp. V48 TaxID=509635 RepID=UPI0003E4852A|nr:pyridoxal phosphate-dependent aminotransferase [Pedobacter sp. V48]ETZ20994.1 hypothetical protein N824_02455 [Pedobacter sp. V48]